MSTLVMKFGGAAVTSENCFGRIADLIVTRHKKTSRIAVVISAMGNTTDQLIALAKKVHPTPPCREYDMLLTVGERISISLLAMALELKNLPASSFTGSQTGIITSKLHSDARIIEVRPKRILPLLDEGRIAIVAGFQGVSTCGEITTLGRGGSDTSAVALALAIGAEEVEFYKDVPGIYSEDPKENPGARYFEEMTFDEALSIAERGKRKVLHPRAIALAKENGLPLLVCSFNEHCNKKGTKISDPAIFRKSPPTFESPSSTPL